MSLSGIYLPAKGQRVGTSPPPGGRLLEGAVSIVMGGSTGIGLAAARCLARHGSAVELAANDEASVTAAVGQLRADGQDAVGP